MSIALAHFAIGATMATVAILYFIPRVPYPRVVILLSGVWAMIPDITQLGVPFESQFLFLETSVWGNLFWFHSRIDTIDALESFWFAVVALSLFIGSTALAERWSYNVIEHRPDEESQQRYFGQSVSSLLSILSLGCLSYAGILLIGTQFSTSYTSLYIGTAAVVGLLGLLGMVSVVPAKSSSWHRLPDSLQITIQLLVTLSCLAIAGSLLTSLRSIDALDPISVGIALILVTLLAFLGNYWS